MNIVSAPQYRVAYFLLPYKRNQDVVHIFSGKGDVHWGASVVDGWNWSEKILGNISGRRAATFVASEYPAEFIATNVRNMRRRAEEAARSIDQKFLQKYPQYVGATGSFLFDFGETLIVVFVGKGTVLTWNGKTWQKPRGLGNYSLRETSLFPNDVSRFFGRGELKVDSFYSAMPDVVEVPSKTPVFIATDGLDDVIAESEMNHILQLVPGKDPADYLAILRHEIIRYRTQTDDITFFLRI